MYHSFFIHLSVNGRLCCFPVLPVANSATMNIRVRMSFSILETNFWCRKNYNLQSSTYSPWNVLILVSVVFTQLSCFSRYWKILSLPTLSFSLLLIKVFLLYTLAFTCYCWERFKPPLSVVFPLPFPSSYQPQSSTPPPLKAQEDSEGSWVRLPRWNQESLGSWETLAQDFLNLRFPFC